MYKVWRRKMREVIMNNKTNLLQLEEHFYQLADVSEPNTFRNLFPYSEIPKIAFNDRIVPHNMPEDIWITDTTFRDGQQSRAPYTTEQIVTIYDYMHRLGGPKGKIRQSEFFLYSKKDREAHHAHHLLTTQTHQIVKEGREGRHAYRGDKSHKRDMF